MCVRAQGGVEAAVCWARKAARCGAGAAPVDEGGWLLGVLLHMFALSGAVRAALAAAAPWRGVVHVHAWGRMHGARCASLPVHAWPTTPSSSPVFPLNWGSCSLGVISQANKLLGEVSGGANGNRGHAVRVAVRAAAAPVLALAYKR